MRFNRVFFKLFAFIAIPILVIQPSYTSIALATEKLPKQIKNIEVPPLYQNQATSSAAQDNNSNNTSPILTTQQLSKPQNDHEDISKRTEHTKTIFRKDGKTTKKISLTEPLHFQKNGKWEDLNPKVVKSQPPYSPVGQSEPIALSVGDLKMTARPLGQGISYAYKDRSFLIHIPESNNSIPKLVKEDGKDVVVYANVFKDVDIKYFISGYAIKELVVLKSKEARNSFSFSYKGVGLKKHTTINGAMSVTGLPDESLYISPLNIATAKYFVTDPVITQESSENTILVKIKKDWLSSLSNDQFPVVVDPTMTTLRKKPEGPGSMQAIRSDGYRCGIESCSPQVGNEEYPTYWASWRTWIKIPFGEITDSITDTVNVSARLHMVRNGGVADNLYIQVAPAKCLDFYCDMSEFSSAGQVGSDDWINLDYTIKSMLANRMGDTPLILYSPHETVGLKTVKSFDLSQMYLEITYLTDKTPSEPPMSYPEDKKVISTLQPSLSVLPVTDPDGDKVRYTFYLMSSSKDIITSSTSYDTSWTIPDGILKDGATYYWSAVAASPQGGSPPGAIRSFKVDTRKGKNFTQTYDTAGPISINQATGNASMSISSHSVKALGGNLGISLNYDTPTMSREGLVAEYWDKPSLSGNAKITTVVPEVNFNWGQYASPSNIVRGDSSFSARYSGYINVPQSGLYTFGADKDDGVKIYINDQLVLDSWNNSGTLYGNSINLIAGKPNKIKIEYVELSGLARLKLLAKGPTLPVEGKIVDRSWFQTGVKQSNQDTGLLANYFLSTNNDFPANSPLILGEETTFDYRSPGGLRDRAPGGVYTDMVKYKGYIKVPTTGVYKFSGIHAGGLRLSINNTQVINNWDRGAFYSPGSEINLTAGQWLPIEIDYIMNLSGQANLSLSLQGPDIPMQIIPASWLSQKKEILPSGWQMSVDTTGSRIDRIRVGTGSATLIDSSGSSREYKWDRNSFIPPTGEHGILTLNTDKTYSFKDDDGYVYQFNTDGTLKLLSSPTDDKKPASLKYTYAGTPSRLTRITDGVNSSRYADLYYADINDNGSCAPPAGWDKPPVGYLCKIKTFEGTETLLRYKAGNLARVVGSGDTNTDFGYDTMRRIVQVRDPLANDAISTGQRLATEPTTYNISYDELGKVSKVIYPPATPGAIQLGSSYNYFLGRTEMHKLGVAEPRGYSQKIEYDKTYRTTRQYGHDGKAFTTNWHSSKDIILSTVDALGMKSTIIYDHNQRPTAKYGPAPSDWYEATNLPKSSYANMVPKSETRFDGGMQGLSASFYDNKNLVREPKARTFERGDLMRQWTSGNRPVTPGVEGWGVQLTGEILLPSVGLYEIKLYSDDGVRLYLDDKLYIDDWKDGEARYHTSTKYDNQQANKRIKIRIDYYDKDQNDVNSKLELRIYKPGAAEAESIQTGQFMSPDFSLPTSNTVTDSTIGKVTNSRYYSRPEYGLLDKIVLDNGGLGYTSTMSVETPGQGFFRQTAKTLPGGNKTVYQYYASTETRDNPCTTAVEANMQAGMPKGRTDPDPDGSGPLTGQKNEVVYNQSGQVVASRNNSEPFTCITYDNRGRITKTVTPASGNRPGMTSTTNYAVDGNPLKIATSDVNGSVTTEIDLLGRTTKYTDVYGKMTSFTYDTQGRLSKKSSPIGVETFVYDSLDRLTKYDINGVVMADLYYDEFSRIKNIDYPASNQKLLSLEYDSLLRVSAINWQLGDGTKIREAQTKTSTGLVLSNTRTIGTDTLNQAYTYDKAARLRSAQIGSHSMSYDFDPSPSTCGASSNVNAHKNSNRTSQTIDGVKTTYCYDFADRLMSSSDANYNNPVYDDRGNITQIGSTTKPIKFSYDQANRNIKTEQRDTGGNGAITELKRDAGGRVIARKEIKLTNGAQSTISDVRYSYTNSGDSPDIITDTAGNLIQRQLNLPGGVSLTLHSGQTDVAKQRTYSIPNFHGDTMVTTDYYGKKTGVFTYDPFGNQLDSTVPPKGNSPPGTSYGYLGSSSRLSETPYSIPIMQMGERTYLPGLGRFTQTDPVEGGNANAYIYPADPVNSKDLDGRFAWFAPLVWMAATAIISAVTVYLADKLIDTYISEPYREPAKTAVEIISYVASPSKGAAKAVTKAPAIMPTLEKGVANVFGSAPFKSTIEFGKAQHDIFKKMISDPDMKVFMRHKDGKKGFADAITETTVYELKPDNPRAIRQGLKQLQKYSETTRLDGQLWVYREKLGEFRCVHGCNI